MVCATMNVFCTIGSAFLFGCNKNNTFDSIIVKSLVFFEKEQRFLIKIGNECGGRSRFHVGSWIGCFVVDEEQGNVSLRQVV